MNRFAAVAPLLIFAPIFATGDTLRATVACVADLLVTVGTSPPSPTSPLHCASIVLGSGFFIVVGVMICSGAVPVPVGADGFLLEKDEVT